MLTPTIPSTLFKICLLEINSAQNTHLQRLELQILKEVWKDIKKS